MNEVSISVSHVISENAGKKRECGGEALFATGCVSPSDGCQEQERSALTERPEPMLCSFHRLRYALRRIIQLKAFAFGFYHVLTLHRLIATRSRARAERDACAKQAKIWMSRAEDAMHFRKLAMQSVRQSQASLPLRLPSITKPYPATLATSHDGVIPREHLRD